jgi:tetratricopeptide (TPR) repeat protein
MGEDDEKRGDLAGALSKFLEAKRTTGALLAAAPSDAQRIYDHAQSEYWVAFIAWRRGRVAEAEVGFKRYAELADQLLKAGPSNPDWRMEAGYADSNLGMLVLRDKGDAAQAEILFNRALGHFKTASKARPNDAEITRELADGYAWLADSQREQARYDLARVSRASEGRLLRGMLVADPKNAVYARDLLGNALSLAQLDLDQGRPGLGVRRLQSAYAEAGLLVESDPLDKTIAKQRIMLGLSLARMRLAEGATASAVRQSQTDCALPIVSSDPELFAFCSIIQHRTAIYAGASIPRSLAPLPQTRRSVRWGINFIREAQLLRSQRRYTDEFCNGSKWPGPPHAIGKRYKCLH